MPAHPLLRSRQRAFSPPLSRGLKSLIENIFCLKIDEALTLKGNLLVHMMPQRPNPQNASLFTSRISGMCMTYGLCRGYGCPIQGGGKKGETSQQAYCTDEVGGAIPLAAKHGTRGQGDWEALLYCQSFQVGGECCSGSLANQMHACTLERTLWMQRAVSSMAKAPIHKAWDVNSILPQLGVYYLLYCPLTFAFIFPV